MLSEEGQDGNQKHCQFTAIVKETKDDSMYLDRFTKKGKMEKKVLEYVLEVATRVDRSDVRGEGNK